MAYITKNWLIRDGWKNSVHWPSYVELKTFPALDSKYNREKKIIFEIHARRRSDYKALYLTAADINGILPSLIAKGTFTKPTREILQAKCASLNDDEFVKFLGGVFKRRASAQADG